MPSKMTSFLFGVPMFVGCCAILWIYWDSFKKPPKPRGPHKKKIFISCDGWLAVFNLLAPSQVGQGIAMISHRFDNIVDKHFETRRWTLKSMGIGRKIEKNGTKKLKIVNSVGLPLAIPQIQLPHNVSGFKRITISFIDQNAIAFLHRFRPLFASCPLNLFINTTSDRILEFILDNIWPLLCKNFDGIGLSDTIFFGLRQFVPSILDECPSLRIVSYVDDLFAEFPADDSAMASDGQAMAKWLFTPRPDDVPKVLRCWLDKDDGDLASKIEAFKAAFANASSPANSIIYLSLPSPFASVVPFDLTNESTREQLTLKRTDFSCCFLFVRCPIARDESKWTKWEKEAIGWIFFDQWNRIDIRIDKEDEIGEGLLNAMVGPNDWQQK